MMKNLLVRYWWIALCMALVLAGASSVMARRSLHPHRLDDLTLTILNAPVKGAQGSAVAVRATVTNNSDHPIFLNQLSITLNDTDLIAGDTGPFQSNFSGALAPGASISAKTLCNLSIDTTLATGTYNGTAVILGGADGDALDNEAQQDFQVSVIDQDTTPPTTAITNGPDDFHPACSATIEFDFYGTDNVTAPDALTFQYRVDGGAWQNTSDTTATLTIEKEGAHTFEVAAIDESGNTDPNPARRTFNVFLTPATLSDIAAAPRDVKAIVKWTTSRPATSQVEYGPTTAYGSASDLDTGLNGTHTVTLAGLTPKTTYHYRVKSSDGCRDVVSDDQTFTTTDALLPNLSVSTLKSAASVRPLDTVAVSWQVFNSGPGDTSGTWMDAVYLSDSAALGPNAQLLGKFNRPSALDAFSSYDQSRQIQMPLKPAGVYYLIVKTDADNDVKEGSEDDNTFATPIEFLKASNLVASPGLIALSLNPTIATQGEIQMGNLSGGPLTGITATIENPQSNLTIQVTPPSSLESLTTQKATYTITASDESILQSAPVIHFTTAEGEDARVTLNVSVIPRRPQLQLTLGSFVGGMTRGKQNTLEAQITNTGSVSAFGLKVSVPQTDWLTLASPANLGTLAPGASAKISLLLSPSLTLPLGSYTGNIAITGSNTSLLLPFNIINTSDAKGDLKVIAQDEYSFFADTKPNVAGALAVLKDAQTGAIVAQGTTNEQGEWEQQKIAEGAYNLEVTAAKHGKATLSVLIRPGQEQVVTPFLPRDTVQYTWSVVPVDIIDRTLIVLESTFETHVPIPVVTIDPGFVDVRDLQFDDNGKTVVNYVITNHGLIAAQGMHFTFNDDPDYTVTPAISDLGSLPALTTRIVPVTIQKNTRIGLNNRWLPENAKRRACRGGGNGACDIAGIGVYFYVCGKPIGRSIPVDIRVKECPDAPNISIGFGYGGPGDPGNDPNLNFSLGYGGLGGPGSDPNFGFGDTGVGGWISVPTLSVYNSVLSCGCLVPIALCVDANGFFAPAASALDTFIEERSEGWISAETTFTAQACAGICCDSHNNAGIFFSAEGEAKLKLSLNKTSYNFSVDKTVPLAQVRIGGGPPTDISVNVKADVLAGLTATWENSVTGKIVKGGCDMDCVSAEAGGSLDSKAGLEANATGSVIVGGKEVGKWTAKVEGIIATGLSYDYKYECGKSGGTACFKGVYAQYAVTADIEIFGDKVYSVEVVKPTRHYFACPVGDCKAEAPEGYILEGCGQ